MLEISDVDGKRNASDVMPYLPQYRPLFTPLPTDAERIKSNIVQVALDDVEAITQTLVKVKGPHWYIKVAKGKVLLFAMTTTIKTNLNSATTICRRGICENVCFLDIKRLG